MFYPFKSDLFDLDERLDLAAPVPLSENLMETTDLLLQLLSPDLALCFENLASFLGNLDLLLVKPDRSESFLLVNLILDYSLPNELYSLSMVKFTVFFFIWLPPSSKPLIVFFTALLISLSLIASLANCSSLV